MIWSGDEALQVGPQQMSTSSTAAGDPAAVYPEPTKALYCLILLFLAYILSFIDRQILSLLVGPIREEFGITDFQYSLLQGAAFALLYSVAGLPLGRLADRYSRKLIVSGSVLFWSLMTMGCGVTRDFSQLFVARMGVGAGEAGLSPPAYSLILDSFRPEQAGFAMSFYKLGVYVGGGIALVVGGVLFDYFSSIGGFDLPFIGNLKAWQLTLISVGAPGLLLSVLLLTITEPTRKDLVGEAGKAIQLPISSVGRFIWVRRRVYLTLFLGSSMLAMAGYGSAAWYPEFLFRTYGMTKSEAGYSFGMILLTAGSAGVMFGAWMARKLSDRGYKDANIRTIFITSLLALPLTVAAPITGDSQMTLLILWPGVMMGSSYLGVMAVAIVVITPNQMRGQITAVYIFVTNILGMAIGTSVLAAFTDFLYQDDGLLHYSIATANGLFYPVAAVLFWYCLAAYRVSFEEAGQWQVE